MLYRRSLVIERSLGTSLELIQPDQCSTQMLVEKMSISIATVLRTVTVLCEVGSTIRSDRREDGLKFALVGRPMKSRAKAPSGLAEERL